MSEQHTSEEMYLIGGWTELIQKVQVVKRTASFVTYVAPSLYGDGTATNRKAAHHFRTTWDEARDWLVTDAERMVRQAQSELDRCKSRLSNLKSMVKP